MRKYIRLAMIAGGLLLGLLLVVAVFRLWQLISRPEALLFGAHSLLMLGLAVWLARLAADMILAGRMGKPLRLTADQVEARYLLGLSLLLAIAFLLAAGSGQGLAAAGPAWTLAGRTYAQAGLAWLVVNVLFWLPHLLLRRLLPDRDPFIYPLACLLAGMGLVFLFRLGPDIAVIRGEAGFAGLFRRQVISLAVALPVFLFSVSYFSEKRLESLTRKRYVYVLLSIILIAVTALFGTEINGRKLALNLGVANFQTVELVKILALFFMVGYFRYEMGFLEPGKNRLGLPRGRYLVPYLTMWVLTLLPLFLQRDLGPTALIFAMFMTVFYLGTGSWATVALGLLILAAAGAATYFANFPSMVHTRLDMWFDPFGRSQNMAEALWAITSGGWLGVGLGRGLSHHIPVVQSDFNLAVIAEEWGLAGVTMALAGCGLLVWRALSLAVKSDPPYRQMLLAGLGLLWMLQTFIIVGGNLGLLPLTGITLPFISFGGSALLVNFLMLGLVLRHSGKTGMAESGLRLGS